MHTDPLVSVVIPTYNRADIICDTVENVFAQTYPNVEIIVVDDGSTDKTLEKLVRFRDRLRVVSQANAGPAAARNRGAALARGEFIAFQDSDDLWKPTKLESQLELLRSVGECVPCCLCNAVMHLSNGSVTSSFEHALLDPQCERGIWLNVAEVLATRFVLFNQAVVIRRRAWEKIKGFDESLKYLEDYELPLRLAFEGPWAIVRTPLAIYHQGSPSSFSRQGHADQIVLKQCEIKIFEQALSRARAQDRGPSLQKHLERRLGVFRRTLRFITLAQSGVWGAGALSRLFCESERYRYSVFARLPWFPKMRAIPTGMSEAEATGARRGSALCQMASITERSSGFENKGFGMESKIGKLIRAVGKRIGPRVVKQAIWDREHAQGQWDWARDATRPQRQRDIAYEVLDHYSTGADVLDLGCGNGYAGRMIASNFREYFGVDVSEVAVDAARRDFAADPERGPKSHFATGDILYFVPPKTFSVVLFSDCLYYFALHQVKQILHRYSVFLASDGVFVVRLCDRDKYRGIAEHIEGEYRLIEKVIREDSAGVVLTFVPRLVANVLSLASVN